MYYLLILRRGKTQRPCYCPWNVQLNVKRTENTVKNKCTYCVNYQNSAEVSKLCAVIMLPQRREKKKKREQKNSSKR